MGRKRKSNKHLPPRVYFKHGAFFFATPEGRWLRLGKTEPEMYAELARLSRQALGEHGGMSELFDRYAKEVIPTKSPRTQKDNRIELANLRKSFGHITEPDRIKPIHIYQYRDARGAYARTRANRELALLSHVFSCAVHWGVVKSNPCRDVKKFSEKPRDRYVTDDEFAFVHQLATPIQQAAMELAAITGMRIGDILALTQAQIKPDGLHLIPAKTKTRSGKRLIFEWTDGLRSAIDKAQTVSRRKSSTYVFAKADGTRYTDSGWKASWQRLMQKAVENGLYERFTFHDLRAKAGSESDEAMRLLGHQSPTITNRTYRRRPERVKPVR